MFMKLNKIALILALGVGTIASTSWPANSMPVTVGQPSGSDNIVSVQYDPNRRMGQDRQWSRERDGNRCRTPYGNCRRFYRGYYYETPWWTLPLIVGGAIASQNDYGHSARPCSSHNRGYRGRDGQWHSCRRW